MTDGDLVRAEIDGDMFVSITLVSDQAEATHVVVGSWRYKDFSCFGLTLEAVVPPSEGFENLYCRETAKMENHEG